jgi:Flp pilus assembly protein TadD
MQPLDIADQRHLDAAEGWLGLGSYRDAQEELEQITRAMQIHPEVLQVRWEIQATAKDWPRALESAATMVQVAPEDPRGWIHRSYCLHEMKQTEAARDNLLRVADQFKSSSTLCYNLACYECQLGRLEQARSWLRKAIASGDAYHIKQTAQLDADLKPLWDEIPGY